MTVGRAASSFGFLALAAGMAAGVGCGGGNYCPTAATTRGQMAPFLVKTFGLLLYGS